MPRHHLGENEGVHHFDDENQRLWLEEALPEPGTADHIVVTPYGASGPGEEPRPIRARTPDGQEVEAALVIWT